MEIKNVFNENDVNQIIDRINKITPESNPIWGKMNPSQMFAHCNVSYNYTFEPEKFKKPNFFMGFILKNFIKKLIVSDKPYKQNSQTAPDFIIKNQPDFNTQKDTLVQNIWKVQKLGEKHFDGLENFNFGVMSKDEWNRLFYKHLDHHLRQFGV